MISTENNLDILMWFSFLFISLKINIQRKGKKERNKEIKALRGLTSLLPVVLRGAMVEWLEQLGYSAESRRKA